MDVRWVVNPLRSWGTGLSCPCFLLSACPEWPQPSPRGSKSGKAGQKLLCTRRTGTPWGMALTARRA